MFTKTVFFSKKFQNIETSTSPALGCYWLCTENSQPTGVSVHKGLTRVDLLSYTQGGGCSEVKKNTIFLEHPVHTPVLNSSYDFIITFALIFNARSNTCYFVLSSVRQHACPIRQLARLEPSASWSTFLIICLN